MLRKNNRVEDLQKRLEQSQRDKHQLKKSIEELNECYTTKIQILQSTIEAYESRIQQLLESRKTEIQKQLSVTQKYEQENKKLLDLISQLNSSFEQQRLKFQQIIKTKDEEIAKITFQKDQLASRSQDSEQKLDQLVIEHTKQIEQLKNQLIMLKDEVMQGSSQETSRLKTIQFKMEQVTNTNNEVNIFNKQCALRQITNISQKQLASSQDFSSLKHSINMTTGQNNEQLIN